jgi:four helix bundle protein
MGRLKSSGNKPTKPGFENLRIWKKAYELMLRVHEICRALPRDERFKLRDQAERSSSSVPDNIAEGHSAYFYKEKIKCFYTARREAGETQNHLRKMEGKGYISSQQANNLITEYEGLIRGINAYISYIREKKDRGKNGAR